jgi:hypothetical protein
MDNDSKVSEGLREIEQEMQCILAGQTPAYDAAWNIWGKAMSLVPESPNVMHPFWLIWGAITDWVENRPAERLEAETKMRQAAQQWFEINRDDVASVKSYCDRWVYDEMGYEGEQG